MSNHSIIEIIYTFAQAFYITDQLIERENHYQEVVFNPKPDSYYENIASLIKSISKHATNQYGWAILCTVYPMSFREWNKTLLNTNKTIVLHQQQHYEAMQRDLELAVEKINDIFIHANVENGVTTPLFHNASTCFIIGESLQKSRNTIC